MAYASVLRGGPRSRRRGGRRRRLLRRAAPLAALAGVAFAAGLVVATTGGPAEQHLVRTYVDAWARGDYRLMYGLLDPASRRHLSEARFVASYRAAASTATVIAIVPVRVGSRSGDAVPVLLDVRTRLFGVLARTLEVPVRGSGSSATVRWTNALLFPGLRAGEHLTRQVTLPPRAALLASDGTPLAQGPNRSSPIPAVASEIVGTLGSIPSDQRAEYAARGYPPNAKVGLDGLERAFEAQLVGTPGGTLFAGRRVLAQSAPVPAAPVRTTIDPVIEQAAINARAGRFAGIAAIDPRTGAIRALAGLGFSAIQPPGSTMKIITVTAALAAGIVKPTDTFPIATSAAIGGYQLQNANGEACGGTLVNAFAVSCNSVFAPIGVQLGAARLVAMAERFGFNQPPTILGAAESTIPSAGAMGGDVAVGSSAIGQGQVQASALEMTDVAATIAMGGRRPIPTLLANQKPRFVPVTSRRIARIVQQMMVAVVQYGTGQSAQISGVTVAGKTGTAELRNTTTTTTTTGTSTTPAPNTPQPQNTDAWFVGYVPVGRPRIVAGALFPNQGAGGATAAPAIRGILEAALHEK